MRIVAVNRYIFKFGRKCRVTAMVGPIRVYYFNFRLGRISSLALEIIAHENEVRNGHGKPCVCMKLRYLFIGQRNKAVNRFHVFRLNCATRKRLGLI